LIRNATFRGLLRSQGDEHPVIVPLERKLPGCAVPIVNATGPGRSPKPHSKQMQLSHLRRQLNNRRQLTNILLGAAQYASAAARGWKRWQRRLIHAQGLVLSDK
jgi:hypothetical protein